MGQTATDQTKTCSEHLSGLSVDLSEGSDLDGEGQFHCAGTGLEGRRSIPPCRDGTGKRSDLPHLGGGGAGPDGAGQDLRAWMKASTARSTSSMLWAAESWTRIRAWPCGTTG